MSKHVSFPYEGYLDLSLMLELELPGNRSLCTWMQTVVDAGNGVADANAVNLKDNSLAQSVTPAKAGVRKA